MRSFQSLILGVFIKLSLLLSCLFIRGDCLTFKVSERILCTELTEKGLEAFFSIIPPFAKNYHFLSALLRSTNFDFKKYYISPTAPEELFFLEKHDKIPMLPMVSINRLQKTDYGRKWLVNNLNKLVSTDLGLAFMKPKLFTLEQQRAILTFGLTHQRPFMRDDDFCRIFQDLSVFDHEWLWLYLDPICFSSLFDKERHLKTVEILQKKAYSKKDTASPAAILFLILMKQPINWNNVDSKQPELIVLLQSYKEAHQNVKDPTKVWEAYGLLVPHFKDFPLGGYSTSLLHALALIDDYSIHGKIRSHDAITEFMNLYQPTDLSCHLVILLCTMIYNLNESEMAKFKVPLNWKNELLKNYINDIPGEYLSHNLRVKQWRRINTALTLDRQATVRFNNGFVYLNGMIGNILLVDFYNNIANKLIKDEHLKLEPTLKFDCRKPRLEYTVLEFWLAKIYQVAINDAPLPALHEKFKDAVFAANIVSKGPEQDLELISSICIDAAKVEFDIVSVIATATSNRLHQFNLDAYYNPKNDYTILE